MVFENLLVLLAVKSGFDDKDFCYSVIEGFANETNSINLLLNSSVGRHPRIGLGVLHRSIFCFGIAKSADEVND